MTGLARFDCPECGTRLSGGRPGSVRACGQCRNPVVVPPSAPREAAPAPAEAPPAFDAERARRRLLTTAGVVLALLLAAHVGLYLLLTRDARAGVAAAEGRHPVRALEGARPPEGDPAPGTPAYRTWREAKALWVDAEAWRNDRRQVGLLRGGITGSFLLQAVILAWVLLRLLGSIRRRARG